MRGRVSRIEEVKRDVQEAGLEDGYTVGEEGKLEGERIRDERKSR
jgi:hypothetical protein